MSGFQNINSFQNMTGFPKIKLRINSFHGIKTAAGQKKIHKKKKKSVEALSEN